MHKLNRMLTCKYQISMWCGSIGFHIQDFLWCLCVCLCEFGCLSAYVTIMFGIIVNYIGNSRVNMTITDFTDFRWRVCRSKSSTVCCLLTIPAQISQIFFLFGSFVLLFFWREKNEATIHWLDTWIKCTLSLWIIIDLIDN